MKPEKIYKMSGLTFFGIAASEVLDSSAELIDIEGCDISDFEKGVGQFNWEHFGDNEVKDGKSSPGQNWVGRIVFAKKIINSNDATTDLEKKCWDHVKVPFIFVIGRLYDSAGHVGAQALAAIMRDAHRNGEKNIVRMSIEGSTLKREEKNPNIIQVSVAKNIALTVKPCNKTCDAWVLYDPNAPDGFEKNPEKFNTSVLKDIAKEMNKSLQVTEFDSLSKKEEKDSAKRIINALVAAKAIARQHPLHLFKKLLPSYQNNAKNQKPIKLDDSTLNFINHVKNAPVTINFSPTKLKEMVQDGRFKNQFEKASAFDRADRDERKLFEKQKLGIPLNTSNRNRPIYGALHLGHADPESEGDGGASMYGSAFLKLKPDVKNRSSFTHNDSYVVEPGHVMPPEALDSVAINYMNDPDKSDFIEAQIHGGVDFSKDLDSLHIPAHPDFIEHGKNFKQKFNVPVFTYDDDGKKNELVIPEVDNFEKTLTAGNYNAAPGALTGGAALQVEDQGLKKKKIKKLIEKAFEKSGLEKTKENLTAFIKANLPEIDEDFIDHFDDVADNLHAQKALIRKAEFLVIELQKNENLSADNDLTISDPIDFNGQKVVPGIALLNGKIYYLLQDIGDSFLAAPSDAISLSEDSLVKLPKNEAGNKFILNSVPIIQNNNEKLNSINDSVFPYNCSESQHGILENVSTDSNGWVNGVYCQKIESNFEEKLAYFNLASNFFNLKGNVPIVAIGKNPNDNSFCLIQSAINGAFHPNIVDYKYIQSLKSSSQNGSLEMILFCDYVLGVLNRTRETFVCSLNDDNIYIIDDGDSFNEPFQNGLANDINAIDPSFLQTQSSDMMLKFVQSLNPKDLYQSLIFHKIPVNKIQMVLDRFDKAQKHILNCNPSKVF